MKAEIKNNKKTENADGFFTRNIAAPAKDVLYGISVRLHGLISTKTKRLNDKKKYDLIFYILMFAFPILQFCVFYIGVNFNSLLLSLQKYNYNRGVYQWIWFENYKAIIYNLTHSPDLQTAFKNSVLIYGISLVTTTPLGLLFSFYIYKKKFAHNLFKVMLFLPSIISSIALTTIFRYFADRVVPNIWKLLFQKEILGLFSGNYDIVFITLIFYNILTTFGPSMLMYTGAMSNISESISESAQLEGANSLQEFWYISLPLVYPTVVVFIVVGVSHIFINQANLFNYYSINANARLMTFGYILFRNTKQASISEYPYLAGMGIIFTIVAVPLTFLIRWILQRIGPSVE